MINFKDGIRKFWEIFSGLGFFIIEVFKAFQELKEQS
jgi:hypothetical protein